MCSTLVVDGEPPAVGPFPWEPTEADALPDPSLLTVDATDRTPLASVAAPSGGSPWARVARLFRFDHTDSTEAGEDLSDAALLARMRDCDALVSQANAHQARLLRELRRRRLLGQAAAHPHPGVDVTSADPAAPDPTSPDPAACTTSCCDPDGWVAPEVAVELALTERQVQSRLGTALQLRDHPAVDAALTEGLLQAWTAVRLLEHLDALAPYLTLEQLAEVEAATLTWLLSGHRTVAQLSARMRRLLLAARAARRDGTDRSDGPGSPDPADGGPREPEHADRHVTVTAAVTPGLAELVALLPEADALALRATLYALAHDRAGPDDPRTAAQRRADLLVTLVTGHPALEGRPADVAAALHAPVDLQVHLDLTLPVDSLTATGHAPAWVPGYGEVPAATARDLAAGASTSTTCTGRPLVYDPGSGRLLGFASTPVRLTWLAELRAAPGYQHPLTLERAARLRDGTCRAPGCRRPAAQCDCDHVVPYPTGPTSLTNSCSLCRRHHRLKTHAPGWRTDSCDGEVTWTTPTGRTVSTQPHDHRPVALPGRASDPDPPPF